MGKSIPNNIFGKRLKAFPQDWEQGKDACFHYFCSTLHLASNNNEKKKRKMNEGRKRERDGGRNERYTA